MPASAEAVRSLFEEAPDWFKPAIGLRQGEASGPTADRIDWLGERAVPVDRQWSSRKHPHGFGPLKSESSYRTIPVPADVLAELGRSADGRRGFVLHRDSEAVGHHPVQHAWRQTVKRAGLEPGLRFHSLRHRFASVLLSGGCSIVAVQRAMGHSSAAITLGIYGHLMPSDHGRLSSAMAGQSGSAEDSLRTNGLPRRG